MTSDLTRQTLQHDSFFGRQLISFSVSSKMDGKYQAVAGYWYIAKNKDGIYGMIGGGNNGIGAFIGWCTGLSSWCFNPINLDDYVWSIINNAYISKDFTFLRDIRIVPGEFYYYQEDSNYEIIEFYKTERCFDKISLWTKKS